MEDGQRWVADRVETLREDYRKRLRAHRDGLEDLATKLGWSFLVHHTDRSAAEPLLALIARLQTGARADRFAGAAFGGAR
jgi:uncharacterized protein (DUF58 family)